MTFINAHTVLLKKLNSFFDSDFPILVGIKFFKSRQQLLMCKGQLILLGLFGCFWWFLGSLFARVWLRLHLCFLVANLRFFNRLRLCGLLRRGRLNLLTTYRFWIHRIDIKIFRFNYPNGRFSLS